MSKFRFWSTLIASAVFALIGVLIADLLPMPAPTTLTQIKLLYGLLGVLVGFLTFGRIAAWLVKTTTRLTRQLALRIAAEVLNQFTQLTSRGWSMSNGSNGQAENLGEAAEAKTRLSGSGTIILDTSSVIDGRVLDIAKTGFLTGIILLPDFVLTELQQVADSADALKRVRGRKGFQTINELKKIRTIKVEVWNNALAGKNVDDKLIRLGRILQARILTCDYNLLQVAKISGVKVLNLNELANALKMVAIPGEKLSVKIVHLGKDKDQGVGYLPDGTMVIIKDAANDLTKTLEVEVDKVIQNPAGRMIFASFPQSSK